MGMDQVKQLNGLAGYRHFYGLEGYRQTPRVMSVIPAEILLPGKTWIPLKNNRVHQHLSKIFLVKKKNIWECEAALNQQWRENSRMYTLRRAQIKLCCFCNQMDFQFQTSQVRTLSILARQQSVFWVYVVDLLFKKLMPVPIHQIRCSDVNPNMGLGIRLKVSHWHPMRGTLAKTSDMFMRSLKDDFPFANTLLLEIWIYEEEPQVESFLQLATRTLTWKKDVLTELCLTTTTILAEGYYNELRAAYNQMTSRSRCPNFGLSMSSIGSGSTDSFTKSPNKKHVTKLKFNLFLPTDALNPLTMGLLRTNSLDPGVNLCILSNQKSTATLDWQVINSLIPHPANSPPSKKIKGDLGYTCRSSILVYCK
eukprot:Gb_20793 [translate_table: standard]